MNAQYLLLLPVLIPFVTAVIGLLTRGSTRTQKWINLAGMTALLASSILLLMSVWQNGIQATQLGGWVAPFGITFVADHLSVIMLVVSAIISFAVAIYAIPDIDENRTKFGFYPFLNLLMVGICGSFLTGDLFNLYVWFEVMLISSFTLMSLGNTKPQLMGAVKYVIVNLVSSMFFLAGVGLLYGLVGTLNMAEIAVRLGEIDAVGQVTAVSILFLVSFGIKAALFPLFFWLPASYHTPPAAVAAFFAGLLTKVGVYALIRVFTLLFTQDVGYTHFILLWVAGLTMVTGVLGAAVQNDFRRVLSFHIISQIGYMIMGLALFTPLALIGAVFYIVHHIIVKANLFLVSGVAQRLGGAFNLKRLGGLYKTQPMLAALFIIPAFSLAGFPPLSGFWAKLILAKAGLETQEYVIVAVALAVGLVTMFSMTKIWVKGFLSDPGDDATARESGIELYPEPGQSVTSPAGIRTLLVPIALLALLTVCISLFAGPVYELAERAANELINTSAYIEAVRGTT